MTTAVDKPILGLALMVGFCVLAPISDAMAKVIGDQVPLLQVVAVRFAAQALCLAPIAFARRATLWPGGRMGLFLVGRTLLQIAGIGLIFLSLRYLPLADAIAIAYVMPFILLLLGHLTLGETVGWRRMAACAVGFGGTILVMQPSFVEVGWVVAMPLAVAVIFAVFMLMTRAVAPHMDPIALQAANGLLGSVLLLPLLALAQGSGLAEADPVWPPTQALLPLLLMALLGTLSHLALTGALRHAPASTLAPMQNRDPRRGGDRLAGLCGFPRWFGAFGHHDCHGRRALCHLARTTDAALQSRIACAAIRRGRITSMPGPSNLRRTRPVGV